MLPDSDSSRSISVIVIGAGPVGLAASAHLAERDVPFLLLEAGSGPAAAVRAWQHVQLFTPWQYNVDAAAGRLLEASGWVSPEPEAFPTGRDLVHDYLLPLAHHPRIWPHLLFGRRVTSITRESISKLEPRTGEHPFTIETIGEDGEVAIYRAMAVIDASGLWNTPNPAGADGRPASGERAVRDRISYGVPDIAGAWRSRFQGQRTLVVGSGHSAFNALSSLVGLAEDDPATGVLWALRGDPGDASVQGCKDDELTERTLVRREIGRYLDDGRIHVFAGTRITGFSNTADGIVTYTGDRQLPPVDAIVVATGFRPDHRFASELRLDLHPVFECAYALAPLIDPEIAACGTVSPHGAYHLAHPEPGYWIVGAKSYGRAPTFLLLTGYEQVRSVVAAIASDEAAIDVQLELPVTGLCSACTAFLEDREVGECSCSLDDDECCAEGPEHDAASSAMVSA